MLGSYVLKFESQSSTGFLSMVMDKVAIFGLLTRKLSDFLFFLREVVFGFLLGNNLHARNNLHTLVLNIRLLVPYCFKCQD